MLLKRWLTAIVLLPILIGVLLKGSALLFFFLVLLITLVSMAEYYTIVSSNAAHKIAYKVRIPGYISAAAMLWAAHTGSTTLILVVLAGNILMLSLVMLHEFCPESMVLGDISLQVQGMVYIPLFLSFLVLIRQSDRGGVWILWLWLIIVASDTGAYYCGSYYGKRPLAKQVSPKKTIEGALGGIAAAIIIGVLFRLLFMPGLSVVMVVLFAAFTAAAGQVGDLFESALKRQGKIKDSGRILPGHGGILDRIDGLIFAVPVAYLFKVYLL